MLKHYTLNDSRTEIKLELASRHEWLQDDSFFRDIVRFQCNLSEPIYFVLNGADPAYAEVAAHLENRIIPNLVYSLTSGLGYQPSINVIIEPARVIEADWKVELSGSEIITGKDAEEELKEIFDMEKHLVAVSVVSEPVNPDCVTNEAISTAQPKTITKRKKKNDN